MNDLTYDELCLVIDHLGIALMEVENMIEESEDPEGGMRMRHEADQVEGIIAKLEGSLAHADV